MAWVRTGIFSNGQKVAGSEARLYEQKTVNFRVALPADVKASDVEFFVHVSRGGEEGVRVRGRLKPVTSKVPSAPNTSTVEIDCTLQGKIRPGQGCTGGAVEMQARGTATCLANRRVLEVKGRLSNGRFRDDLSLGGSVFRLFPARAAMGLDFEKVTIPGEFKGQWGPCTK